MLFSGEIELFNGILYRITSANDISSLTTGRFDIWINYLSFLFDNLGRFLFGGGLGAEMLNKRVAHNTYIDLLYYLGILGTTLLITVFLTITSPKKNTAKLNLLNYSIWICIGVMYFFLSELFYFDCAFHIVIAIMVSKVDMNLVDSRGSAIYKV